MITVKHCYTYLAIWLLDQKNPGNSPTFLTYPSFEIPSREKILKIIKSRIPESEDFSRVKVTLKTHKDKRKILNQLEFNV